jgi:hypothetical protein
MSLAMVNCSWVESMRRVVSRRDLGCLLMDNLSLANPSSGRSSAMHFSKIRPVIKSAHELGIHILRKYKFGSKIIGTVTPSRQ